LLDSKEDLRQREDNLVEPLEVAGDGNLGGDP
jgi:hypothetical protein